MEHGDLALRIAELERDIALLPEGSITKKRIREKDYFYHRTSRNGKRTERYVSFEEEPELRLQLQKRKDLEKQLKALKRQLPALKRQLPALKRQLPDESIGCVSMVREEMHGSEWGLQSAFRTSVRIGRSLKAQIEPVGRYKKRDCIRQLRSYIFGDIQDRVFILYGLRRTGKTTLIRQILSELSEDEFARAAFIQVKTGDTLSDIDSDLRLLEARGYRYVFIDEVTLLEDFIEGAAVFSDIYASSGMKIVFSGTDSLGFAFSKEEQLYDRCIMVHTTFIPYREFEEVLGIKGIDEYIRYGGTMSPGGIDYHGGTAGTYIDTAVARNIQHSLRMYRYGGHFRGLLDLCERGELTNVINRVVENINHSFARSVVECTFKSHDISVTASNLLRDREHPINISEHMNIDNVTAGIKRMLDILNREERSIDISDTHMTQIREYLMLLDLIDEIDLEYLPEVDRRGRVTVMAQPGLRYAQAEAVVENLLLDSEFAELSAVERKHILERLLSEIRGRMMEEIVLFETKLARPDRHVFKLQFAVGEFDMVVCDTETLTCEIYEIKYSRERVPEQCRHLLDENKCALTAHRFGRITGRYVIYRGGRATTDSVEYLNVEEYLLTLGGGNL